MPISCNIVKCFWSQVVKAALSQVYFYAPGIRGKGKQKLSIADRLKRTKL